VLALVRAACLAHPSGKQNSFAAHNLPDLILIEVRPQNVPVSYANAFQKPVRATAQHSLMEASAQALAAYLEKLTTMYELPTERVYATTLDVTLLGAAPEGSLTGLLRWLEPRLAERAAAT